MIVIGQVNQIHMAVLSRCYITFWHLILFGGHSTPFSKQIHCLKTKSTSQNEVNISQRFCYSGLDWQSCMREVNRFKLFHYRVGFKNRYAIKLECCSWSCFPWRWNVRTWNLKKRYLCQFDIVHRKFISRLDVECQSRLLRASVRCWMRSLVPRRCWVKGGMAGKQGARGMMVRKHCGNAWQILRSKWRT